MGPVVYALQILPPEKKLAIDLNRQLPLRLRLFRAAMGADAVLFGFCVRRAYACAGGFIFKKTSR